MTTLAAALKQKTLITKASKAFGLEHLMLTEGELDSLNLVAHKADKTEEQPEDGIGLLETYLSHELGCTVTLQISYYPRRTISLEAPAEQLAKFYRVLPDELELSPPSWGSHKELLYVAASEKIRGFSQEQGMSLRLGK